MDSYLERRAAGNNHQVTSTTPESSALYQLTLGEDLSFQLQRESATWFPLFSTIWVLCQCQCCDEALIRQLHQNCSQSRRQKNVVKVVPSFLQFLSVQDVQTTCVIFSHTDSVCILADLTRRGKRRSNLVHLVVKLKLNDAATNSVQAASRVSSPTAATPGMRAGTYS